jgi:hypothetical protein
MNPESEPRPPRSAPPRLCCIWKRGKTPVPVFFSSKLNSLVFSCSGSKPNWTPVCVVLGGNTSHYYEADGGRGGAWWAAMECQWRAGMEGGWEPEKVTSKRRHTGCCERALRRTRTRACARARMGVCMRVVGRSRHHVSDSDAGALRVGRVSSVGWGGVGGSHSPWRHRWATGFLGAGP